MKFKFKVYTNDVLAYRPSSGGVTETHVHAKIRCVLNLVFGNQTMRREKVSCCGNKYKQALKCY